MDKKINEEIYKVKQEMSNSYKNLSTLCSGVSRSIVFALLAMVGALSLDKGIIILSPLMKYAVFALVLYFFFEIVQYFLTAMLFKFYLTGKLKKCIAKKDTPEEAKKLLLYVKKKKKDVNDIGTIFFIMKLIMLLTGITLIAIDLIPRI